MQVASLGKQLPKPALTGSSPFDQDIESTGYVHFQGTCDSRLTDLTLSFDLNKWELPPTQPDLSASPNAGPFVNDFNCSDGIYSFYLSPKDIQQIWGLTVGTDEGDDVDYIYIRGWSLIGYSETLVLKNNRSGSNSAADRLVLEKNWPKGYAGSEQCEYFEVRLQNAFGERATHTSPITFTLDKRVASTVTKGITAYPNWDACANNTSAQTSFTIPAKKDSLTIIYRFPASPIDTNFEFKIGSASELSFSAEYTSVMLRDSNSATQRWVGLYDHSHQIYKDQCVPFKLQRMTYFKAPDNSPYSDIIDIMASTSTLKFYSNSDCTEISSSLTFAPYSALAEGYMKYSSSGTENGFLNISIQGSPRFNNTLKYDVPPIYLTIDLSSKNTLGRIGSRTTNTMANGQCHPVTLSPENGNGSLIAADSDLVVSLGTTQAGTGSYYADPNCSTFLSTTTIPAGAISSTVYFRPLVSTPGKYTLRFTSGTITSSSHDIEISLAPTKFKLFVAPLIADSCVEVTVKLSDPFGNFYSAAYVYGLSIGISGIDYSTIHSNPTCTNPTGLSQVIPAGSDRATFYIKSLDLLGTPFSLQVHSAGSMEGDSFSGSF